MKTVDLPTKTELGTFANIRILFGHQSVGSNILSGIDGVYEQSGVESPRIVATRDAVAGRGFLAHTHVGVNGDPLSKFADFAALMDGPFDGAVDVALVKLCYVDVTAGSDVAALFGAYESMIDGLQERHPGVRCLYTTVPLTTDRSWKATIKSWLGMDDGTGPADNAARERYNVLVRAKYGSTGRLFDIAAIEATATGRSTTRVLGGAKYFVLNAEFSSDAGHLNELGAKVAAAGLVGVVVSGLPQ